MRRRLGREIPDWRQGLPVGQMGTQTLRPVSHTCVLPLSKIKEQEAMAGGVRALVLQVLPRAWPGGATTGPSIPPGTLRFLAQGPVSGPFGGTLAFPPGRRNPIALHGLVAAGPAGAGPSGGHGRQEPNLGNGGLSDIVAPWDGSAGVFCSEMSPSGVPGV